MLQRIRPTLWCCCSAAALLAGAAHAHPIPAPASQPTAPIAPAPTAPTVSAPEAAKPTTQGAILSTHSAIGVVPVRNWKALRDERIVKQDLDYSCGAASLATLLNYYYGQHLTEAQILAALDQGDGMASFADMARVLPQLGFRGQGLAADWEQLSRLRMPVVVYLHHRRSEHFSVIRGIDAHTVWLADPSLGNRTYSRAQFEQMWQTRAGRPNPELAGKFLAILPLQPGVSAAGEFFTRTPQRQSEPARQQLSFRALP